MPCKRIHKKAYYVHRWQQPFCFQREQRFAPIEIRTVSKGRNRMALVEHTALRAMCPPRDAVSSTLRVSIRGSPHPALPGAGDSDVDNKTHPAAHGAS